MPSKKRALSGALIGAAATALTVKSALAAPIGITAAQSISDIQKHLQTSADAALTAAAAGVTTGSNPLAAPPRTIGAHSSWTPSAASAKAANQSLPSEGPVDRAERDRQTRFKAILRDAAVRHGLDPRLVLALSYWESGWDQSKVSVTGAVGLMQVEPDSAAAAGPALLGRNVDITNPYDNADVGAAILREDLDNFNDPALGVAAYYQGPASLQQNGMLPDTRTYVDGILSLAQRITD